MRIRRFLLLALCAWLPSAWSAGPDEVLDEFHRAAAGADLESYFELMTEDVVFLGTDGTERWQGQAFRDFVRPHFESGRGWTYRPSDRHVLFSEDGETAWFDEALDNDQLGKCRGSGVLLRQGGSWKIAQYNLSVPVPNELVLSVVEQIQAGETVTASAPAAEEAGADIGEGEEKSSTCRRKRHKTNKAAGC